MFAPIAIKSELAFQRLPKWSCARSPENLEVDGFEVMEGFLIKKEHLQIGVGLK